MFSTLTKRMKARSEGLGAVMAVLQEWLRESRHRGGDLGVAVGLGLGAADLQATFIDLPDRAGEEGQAVAHPLGDHQLAPLRPDRRPEPQLRAKMRRPQARAQNHAAGAGLTAGLVQKGETSARRAHGYDAGAASDADPAGKAGLPQGEMQAQRVHMAIKRAETRPDHALTDAGQARGKIGVVQEFKGKAIVQRSGLAVQILAESLIFGGVCEELVAALLAKRQIDIGQP